jgi:hypothetical protein
VLAAPIHIRFHARCVARHRALAAALRCAIVCAALCLLGACGRLLFDPAGDATDAGTVDGPGSDAGGIPDLVAVYPMDDAIIGGIVPALSSAYSGVCDSACPTTVAGKIGGGYAFDGTQWILLPERVAQRIGAPFTIAVWAQPSPTTGNSVLIAKPYSVLADSDAMSLLVLAGTRYVTFETTPDGAQLAYLRMPDATDLEAGDWHHVAISWDGTAKRIYLDGELAGITATTLAISNLPMTIGADVDDGAMTHYYVGVLDDLRVYARALRDDEIAVLAKPHR